MEFLTGAALVWVRQHPTLRLCCEPPCVYSRERYLGRFVNNSDSGGAECFCSAFLFVRSSSARLFCPHCDRNNLHCRFAAHPMRTPVHAKPVELRPAPHRDLHEVSSVRSDAYLNACVSCFHSHHFPCFIASSRKSTLSQKSFSSLCSSSAKFCSFSLIAAISCSSNSNTLPLTNATWRV